MKQILITFIFSLTCWSANSQDIIILNTGEEVQSKVLEITTSEIKYKKIKNLDGPTYSILKSELIKINYENGTTDIFNNNVVSLDEEFVKISRDNPNELTKKGNTIFIEIPDEASRAGERYFIEALNEWGYWNIVTNKNEAYFIIVFNIDKKAMLDKSAMVTFKTREGQVFKKSKYYRGSTSAFNGYNAFKGVAEKIVKKYFMSEFK